MPDIPQERAKLAAQGLQIVTREQWGAVQAYTSRRDVEMPARGFVLHISVTQDPDDLAGHEDDSMQAIERIGQERFGIGFPYNAAAFDTGRLYEGQPLTRRGAHTVNTREIAGFPRDMNYGWRALCLPQMVTDPVTDPQIDAAARWAAAQIRAGLARTGAVWSGHRDYATKGCPGDLGYARIPALNELTRHYETNGLAPAAPPKPKEIEMLIIDCEGRPALVLGVGGVKRLNSEQRGALRLAGVEAKVVTTAASDALWSLREPAVDVDEKALAIALAEQIGGDVSVVEVEAAVRRVFADAAT